MSYSVDWITPIYDRDYNDVLIMTEDSNNQNTKGCFNYSDLNRIENNTKYVAEDMYARRIVRIPFSMSYKLNWSSSDIPTRDDMIRIIQNIYNLMTNCNPIIENDLKSVYNSAQMTYFLANNLEYNLEVLKNQPELPIQKFLLTIENGVINGENSQEYIEENTTVTITGVPYGENAQYMVFDHWSGEAEDLACLDNPASQTTTIEMPYRDVELTAVFKVRFPRTLTLTNAIINDNIGGSTRIVFAGDEIPILADIAEYGKRMYCWTGTEEALELIHGGDEPSTSVLTMPDMDVELEPFYINAGQHSVTITDTDGITVLSQNWYEYGEYVTISAPSKGTKYAFSSWSGSTAYLDDITDDICSFSMPDINIRFTPTYNYLYGYHYVLCADNCLANGEEQLDNYMESSQIQMSLTQAFQNTLDDDTRFNYYQVYEMDNVVIDENTGEILSFDTTPKYQVLTDTPNGIITMPDYDTFIEAITGIAHTLTVTNLNNSGQDTVYKNLKDRRVELSTNATVGQYVFIGWYRGNTQISNKTYMEYAFDNSDDTIEAKYEYRVYHTVTVHNKNNAGGTETIQVLDGYYASISTTEIVGNNIIDKWYFNGSSIGVFEGQAYWSAKVWEDIDIRIGYRARETFTLTVVNGQIQGGGNTYTGLERSTCTIVADTPANKKYFSSWSTTSGSVEKINSSSSSTTSVELGRSDATVQANYGNLYDLTINTSDGVALQGQYRSGTKIAMPNSTMPDTDTEWDKWVVSSGIMSIANVFLMRSESYTGNQDTVVNATYKSIPYFTCTIQNGHFSDNSTTKQIKRNDSPTIIMNPSPFGMKFLMWEIVTGNDNDVSAPLAETSSLNNVTHNITVKATYYVPDDSIKYNMSITNKNGVTTTTSHSVGEEIQIYADSPDEGYEFYKWTGDVSYLVDKYSATTVIRIPNKNVSLGMLYHIEGANIYYHVQLSGGKMVIGERDGEPIWDVDGEFTEGSVVRIKADTIPIGWDFYGWKNTEDNGASMSTVANIMSEDTTLTVENFDIDLIADIVQIGKKKLSIQNGEVSGSYEPGELATIYFNKEGNTYTKYIFDRWTGDTNLQLEGGGNFDTTYGGDGDNPQVVVMPSRHVEIVGEYLISHRVSLINATINGESIDYIIENSTATIQAISIPGKVFKRWSGDIQCIDAIYSPTVILTMPNSQISLVAEFEDINDPNGIGYVLNNIYDNDIINIEDINIISGTIQEGFIITDSKGHIYVITSVSNDVVNIIRLTKKVGGTQNGQ